MAGSLNTWRSRFETNHLSTGGYSAYAYADVLDTNMDILGASKTKRTFVPCSTLAASYTCYQRADANWSLIRDPSTGDTGKVLDAEQGIV